MKKIITLLLSGLMLLNTVVAVSAADFNKAEFEEKYEELMKLIAECENRGIDVDKERILSGTMKRFAENAEFDAMLDENLKNEGTSLVEKTNRSVSYQIKVLNDFYNTAKTSLEGYLDGRASDSVETPYKSGLCEITDDGVYAGDEPYYSMGYGHFGTAQKDVPIMQSVGADHIAMEAGPSFLMEIVSEGNKTYTGTGSKGQDYVAFMQEMLKEAEESNVGVNLLLSTHYIPDWFKNWYPELKTASVGWCGFNIFADETKKFFSTYIEALLSQLKDYTALESIILSNEPSLVTYKEPDMFKTDFNRYLMNKYGKISALNEAWGTSYTSWSKIDMPEYNTNTGLPVKYDALFYEWYIYNDIKFAEWHEWLANEVRKYLPDVKISIKTLDYLWSNDNNESYRGRGISGNDVERYAEFCDFAGVDAHGNISDDRMIIQKYMYYDFVRSLTNQPIYNSEDHMFYDSYKRFGDVETIQDEHVSTSIWQGAIHGCEKTTLWTWERLDYTPIGSETWTSALDRELNSIYNATFLHRPEAVAAAGITEVNLRRLNDEVRTLENAKNNTAILYSKSARIYNLDFIKTMYNTYKTMISSGFGVDFVSEYKPEKMHKYDTIILTGVNNIESNTLKELYDFSRNGGSVIMIDSSIEKNQFDMQGNSDYISGIISSAKTYQVSDNEEEVYDALKRSDTRNRKVQLFNKKGGIVNGIDFKWTENYDGSILVNICNISNSNIDNLTLYVDGNEVSAVDLINKVAIEPDFTAKRYVPILIYIPGNGSFLRELKVEGGNTISWKRELFPAYIYNIDNGMENKALVGIEKNRFVTANKGIYYVRKSDNGVVYPGKIISLQTGTLFRVSADESGYTVTNISDKYSAGILALRYDSKTPAALSFVNLYMEPGEEKYIKAESGADAVVYNNMNDWVKISD